MTASTETTAALALAKSCREFPRTYALKPHDWQLGIRPVMSACFQFHFGWDDMSRAISREERTLQQLLSFAQEKRHEADIDVYCYCEAVGCCEEILNWLARRFPPDEVYGSEGDFRKAAKKLIAKTALSIAWFGAGDARTITIGRLGVLEAAHLALLSFDFSASSEEDKAFVNSTHTAARRVLAALDEGDCEKAVGILEAAA